MELGNKGKNEYLFAIGNKVNSYKPSALINAQIIICGLEGFEVATPTPEII